MPKSGVKRIAVWVEASTAVGRGIIAGVIEVARGRGWRLTHQLIDIDGVIADAGATVIDGLPAVRVLADDPVLPSVICDEAALGALAVDHFRQRGFRHFAFIGDEDTDDARGDGFAIAVERAFPERGHTFAREDLVHTMSDAELHAWIDALPRPLACLCASDALAARVERCSHGNALSIAILGVGDDALICEFAGTPISSIDLNAQQIGIRAAELLARRLAGKTPKSVMVAPRGIVERASTDVLAIDDEDVVAALRFIRANAGSPIGVVDILRATPLTRRSLERRFEKHLGRSPIEVLRRQRIALAQKLLTTTDASMSDIAKQCGFALPQHLAAAFRQIVGQTPTESRKMSVRS